MNLTDYTYLINKPDAINERYHTALEKIVEEFPYFQSARVLSLKHLYNQDSFRYNYALKVAAAFTTDRSVLFDFITSPQFTTVQNGLYDQKVAELMDMVVVGSEHVVHQAETNALEQSILASIKEANPQEAVLEQKLEIGKPIPFSENEKHSFQEWLQLSRFRPIDREAGSSGEKETTAGEDERQKKLALIDKFIAANPKIPAIDKNSFSGEAASQTPTAAASTEDKSYLMTETLAKVYLEQKKYSKAIQAYEILILKYPEKSSFFADRISDIKDLQQNNNN